jgi:hypothetical protein
LLCRAVPTSGAGLSAGRQTLVTPVDIVRIHD